ncbi:MAG: nucleotidyltransferase domain-containing protein [Fretibacterium sp.]|nr:nucleotidyltransferase domain-containing protein [Fretibacterium sp.]
MSLFGSRAREEERPDSDYDFLTSKGTLNSLFALGGLVYGHEGRLECRRRCYHGDLRRP